jgi:chaperone modulatory protein CbpM
MSMQVTHAVWLNDTAVCSIEHLVEVSGLSPDDIRDLVEDGVMAPADASDPGAGFHSVHVAGCGMTLSWTETVLRLR